jgi:hypothetical protein
MVMMLLIFTDFRSMTKRFCEKTLAQGVCLEWAEDWRQGKRLETGVLD